VLKILGRKTSSNVQKVLWCCGEIGIAFERKDIGGEFGGNKSPDYLALNPNGLVPTIDDDGVVIWESNTILRYLAAKHGAGNARFCVSSDYAERDAVDLAFANGVFHHIPPAKRAEGVRQIHTALRPGGLFAATG